MTTTVVRRFHRSTLTACAVIVSLTVPRATLGTPPAAFGPEAGRSGGASGSYLLPQPEKTASRRPRSDAFAGWLPAGAAACTR